MSVKSNSPAAILTTLNQMLEQYALRAAGLVYRALGFPPQFFTVLFAVPRIVGYVSHWRESLVDPDVKIMRPQQDYRVRAAHALPSGP